MTSPMDLTGRTVVVTGASSGIGRETAIVLAELGARVVLVARDEARLAATLEAMPGGPHVARSIDLSEVETIPARFKDLAKEVGPLAGMVHSAGVHRLSPVRMFAADDLRKLLAVNVEAAAMLLKAFRQKGVRAESGSVVLLSSVMGVVGQPGASLYGLTKGALIGLCKSAAVELAGEKIRVNCVAPGVVETEMTASMRATLGDEAFRQVEAAHPLGLGTPRDVANASAFLLSDASRWVTGTTLFVDGGYCAL